IDFDLVEADQEQLRHRRVTRPEVVERYPDARDPKLLENTPGDLDVFHQGALGHFNFEPMKGQASVVHDREELRGEAGVTELHRRDVEGQRQVPRPGRGIAAGDAQELVAELANEAAFLGQSDEFARADITQARARPAGERLEAGNAIGRERYQRLVVDTNDVARRDGGA